MSVTYCNKYDKYIDTDLDVETYEECLEYDYQEALKALFNDPLKQVDDIKKEAKKLKDLYGR